MHTPGHSAPPIHNEAPRTSPTSAPEVTPSVSAVLSHARGESRLTVTWWRLDGSYGRRQWSWPTNQLSALLLNEVGAVMDITIVSLLLDAEGLQQPLPFDF